MLLDLLKNSFIEKDNRSANLIKLQEQVCDAEAKFIATLSEEQRKGYLKLSETNALYDCELHENALVYGFNFAITIMKDIMKQ